MSKRLVAFDAVFCNSKPAWTDAPDGTREEWGVVLNGKTLDPKGQAMRDHVHQHVAMLKLVGEWTCSPGKRLARWSVGSVSGNAADPRNGRWIVCSPGVRCRFSRPPDWYRVVSASSSGASLGGPPPSAERGVTQFSEWLKVVRDFEAHGFEVSNAGVGEHPMQHAIQQDMAEVEARVTAALSGSDTAQDPKETIIETKEHHTMKISIKRVTLINGNDITKLGHDNLIEAMSTLTTTISELRRVKAAMPPPSPKPPSPKPSFKAIDSALAEANEAFTAVVEELDRRGG